uniref:Uncharacterized protein n=1 Tax=Amazona collaria TaxID=241587 RepID=A0A8B9G5R2_9PSIT
CHHKRLSLFWALTIKMLTATCSPITSSTKNLIFREEHWPNTGRRVTALHWRGGPEHTTFEKGLTCIYLFFFDNTVIATYNNVTLIIYKFLQQIFQLFSKNLPAGVCNRSKIDIFQNAIHQQIEELEICLSEEQSKARMNFQTWIPKSIRLSVKKYFQRITNFQKDKQYSHCTWEAVQVELRTCLIIFDRLMKKHTP